jgi:DNA ligase-1
MRPQLANDANLATLKYPLIVQPKIDGVRALNINGTLTGRSLDPFKGFGITEYWSRPYFKGLDGEMTLGDNPASTDRLCSLTTGAMGAFKGITETSNLHWWVFDDLTNPADPYSVRYARLKVRVANLEHPRVHLVPLHIANNREELDELIASFFDEGYEGAIIRNLDAPAKEGRPSKVKQELVRVKGWMDSEMLVTGFTEGQTNTNEAKTNTLGRTERSSAKDGMVPNGMVGSIHGTMIGDCFHPITGEKLFADGLPITIGTGTMTDAELLDYFKHPEKLVGRPVKFKHLAHGVKDLPRMGNYISHRLKEDM